MAFSAVLARLQRFSGLGVANWRQAAFRLVAVVGLGIFAGCAGFGGLDASAPAEQKAQQVRDRAGERWRALIAGDMERAYGYLSPASRQVTTLEQYKARVNPRMFRDARIDEVKCEAEICTVRVVLTYDHRMMKGITTPLQESWVLEQGRFWYVYRG
jgi:hypothetical protein